MSKFLCIIICRSTGKSITDLIIDIEHDRWDAEYYARHRAANLFEKKAKYVKKLRTFGTDWYVDSCKI